MSSVKVIYIASNGRSGSTILDMLLGMKPGCFTVGEVQLVGFARGGARLPCGCGSNVGECAYWKTVLGSLAGNVDLDLVSRFRENPNAGRVIRLAELARMLFRPGGGSRERAYARENVRLFEQIREAAQTYEARDITRIIDASKDPYRLYNMSAGSEIDLQAIHLVKDPRAFVYSMIKNDRGFTRLLKSLRMSTRYLVENAIIQLASRRIRPGGKIRIRYEDLVSDVEGQLARVLPEPGSDDGTASENWWRELQHGVAGNASRLRKDQIKADTGWHTEMSRYERLVVWGVTLPLARAYGYRW
jgi:hypothetical protein